ncbi:serine hydrolase, partial [Enterococcus hirae]
LPEGWVDYVTSPSGPQPDGQFGYGAGWWLLNKSEGIPPDTYGGFGNRGQYLIIVPSRDVVIVRRGEDPPGARFDIVAFTRDVLAAL